MSKGKNLPPLSAPELAYLAGRFKLLGEPMRLRILQSVCHEARTVTDIVAATGSTQANVSKHLALLAAGGILERKKDGQCVFYGVKDRLVLQLCELVRSQINRPPKAASPRSSQRGEGLSEE
jgi:ArsR family transcriptional regulator